MRLRHWLLWLVLLALAAGTQTLSPELQERIARLGEQKSKLAEAQKQRDKLVDADQAVPDELNKQLDQLSAGVARHCCATSRADWECCATL
jgi:hypothetical protein